MASKEWAAFCCHTKVYSSTPQLVRHVKQLLQARNPSWRIFYDADDLGYISKDALEGHIAKSHVFACFMDDKTLDSAWCPDEVKFAVRHRVPIRVIVDHDAYPDVRALIAYWRQRKPDVAQMLFGSDSYQAISFSWKFVAQGQHALDELEAFITTVMQQNLNDECPSVATTGNDNMRSETHFLVNLGVDSLGMRPLSSLRRIKIALRDECSFETCDPDWIDIGTWSDFCGKVHLGFCVKDGGHNSFPDFLFDSVQIHDCDKIIHGCPVAVQRSDGKFYIGRVESNSKGKRINDWDSADVNEWLELTKLAQVPSIVAALQGRDGGVLLKCEALLKDELREIDLFQLGSWARRSFGVEMGLFTIPQSVEDLANPAVSSAPVTVECVRCVTF